MFGNAKGWILAAIVLVIEIGLVGWLISLDDITAPTELSAASNLEPLALNPSPRTIVPNGTKGDAGATYRKVITAYKTNGDAYRKFQSKGTVADPKIIEDIALLTQAKDEKFSRLFENSPGEIVMYDTSDSALNALKIVANAATTYATLAANDNTKLDVAQDYYEAVFALGAAMFDERLTYAQAQVGFDLMYVSSTGLISVAKKSNDSKRADRISDFLEALKESMKTWRDIDDKLLTAKPDPLVNHIGDRIRFANASNERMWRVEAALGLGLVRSDVGLGANIRPADIVASEHALKQLAEIEPDPIVKLAAKLARDLDPASAKRAIRTVTSN